MKVTRAGHIRGDSLATPHTQRTAATPRPRTANYIANAHDAHTAANAVCPMCQRAMLACRCAEVVPESVIRKNYSNTNFTYYSAKEDRHE